jgi:hypothetical protein
MEAIAIKSGHEFKDLPRDQMEALWDATKATEGKRGEELTEMKARE